MLIKPAKSPKGEVCLGFVQIRMFLYQTSGVLCCNGWFQEMDVKFYRLKILKEAEMHFCTSSLSSTNLLGGKVMASLAQEIST